MSPLRRNRRSLPVLCLLLVLALPACAPRPVVVESERPAARGDADTGTLRSELRRLAEQQNGFYRSRGRYAESTAELGFRPAGSMSVDVIQGDRDGFSAIARSGGAECAVYSGSVRAPRTYLTAPDVVGCRP